jgi:hypothetical protein
MSSTSHGQFHFPLERVLGAAKRRMTKPPRRAQPTSATGSDVQVHAAKARPRERPTETVGPEARKLAPAAGRPPAVDDLTSERPTVAVSLDIEYWAHLERMAWIPYEGRTQLLAAVSEVIWTVGSLVLIALGLMLVGFDHTSAVDVQKILGVASLGVGATGGATWARRRRPVPAPRRRRR